MPIVGSFAGASSRAYGLQTGGEIPGLQLISTQTFSAVSTVEFDNVFSNNYVQYRIVSSIKSSSTTVGVHARLRTGGVNNTGSIYHIQQFVGNSTSLSGVRYTSQTYWYEFLGISESTFEPIVVTEVLNPFQSTYTSALKIGGMYNSSASSIQHDMRVLGTNVTTSFDGFAILPSSAVNLTGSISVYGYYKGA